MHTRAILQTSRVKFMNNIVFILCVFRALFKHPFIINSVYSFIIILKTINISMCIKLYIATPAKLSVIKKHYLIRIHPSMSIGVQI